MKCQNRRMYKGKQLYSSQNVSLKERERGVLSITIGWENPLLWNPTQYKPGAEFPPCDSCSPFTGEQPAFLRGTRFGFTCLKDHLHYPGRSYLGWGFCVLLFLAYTQLCLSCIFFFFSFHLKYGKTVSSSKEISGLVHLYSLMISFVILY